MRTRKEIILMAFLVLTQFSFGQRRYTFEASVHGIASAFGLNEKSPLYNSRWEQFSTTFEYEKGYGVSLGFTHAINKKFGLNINGRWQHWGGTVKTRGDDPTFFLDLTINYSSFNVPILLNYCLIEKPQFKWLISAGAGVDFSYKVSFIPTNYYGTNDPIERRITIRSPYLAIGTSLEFAPKPNSRLKYIWGIMLADDHLLNPDRFNDYGGYFLQEVIPLNSTLINTFIGIRL